MPTYDEVSKRLVHFEDRELGSGAAEEEIARAERALGVCIRGGYREFLKQFGWGGAGYLELYGLGAGVPAYLDLVAITQSEREEMQPSLRLHLLPIMNDGGGNLHCIDTSMTDEPAVVFWDHTNGSDQKPEVEAADFASWLAEQLEALEE